jgi:exopolysaccharide biosynthesis polyprenyl glycosylphosphotransferase
MIRRISLYEFFYLISWYLLPVTAFYFAGAGLRATGRIHPLGYDYHFVCILLVLLWMITSAHFRLTRIDALYAGREGWRNCLQAIAWTFMIGLTAMFFYRGGSYSRLVMATSALLLVGEAWGFRAIFRRLIVRVRREKAAVRLLVVGTSDFARRTSERMGEGCYASCFTVAFVHLPGEERRTPAGVPVLEMDELLTRKIRDFADEVVIAATSRTMPELMGLVERLKALALPVRLVLDFGGELRLGDRLFHVGSASLLDVAMAPSETIPYVVMKRAFDLAFSLVVLLVAAVPMALIAGAIKLTSTGPVFFAQERVGLNGQSFQMLKFRSMKVAAPQQSDTLWGQANEARCTAIGKLLRRTSLDELPQFFNVLMGDMSVVGPRPERPHFVEKFHDEIGEYNARHHLKSGITGWAQVNGLRGDTDIRERVRHDLYYIENWSLGFDLRIILQTVLGGFFAGPAY